VLRGMGYPKQRAGRGCCPDLQQRPAPEGAAAPAEVTAETPGPREPCVLRAQSRRGFARLRGLHKVPVHPPPGTAGRQVISE